MRRRRNPSSRNNLHNNNKRKHNKAPNQSAPEPSASPPAGESPLVQEDVSESHLVEPEQVAINSIGEQFAAAALAPSLLPTLAYYLSSLLSVLLAQYLLLEERLENMALGIARWFGGEESSERDAGESVASGSIKMDKLDTGRKVKRRRRKDTTPNEVEYYPGMVNLSGVLCYMNSVLQSLASVTSLIAHLDRITALAMETDLPTPVTDALFDILADLNTPQTSQPHPIRPHALLTALHSLPQIRRLLSTREQQDAHELFIVLAEAISDEAMKVATEIVRLRGMAEILSLQAYCFDKGAKKVVKLEKGKEKRKKIRGLAQPWEGLIARRRVCRKCGWCGEVRMNTLGGMELPIPLHGDVSLESCIAEYLAPELLSGVTCEMCSLRQTLNHYKSEHARLSLPPNKSHLNGHSTQASTSSGSFSVLEHLPDTEASGEISDKRKRRAKESKKVEVQLEEMLASGIVSHFGESTLPSSSGASGSNSGLPIKWQKVNSDSIREGIVTRPPQTLRLHITRSGMTPYGQLVKKSARVAFPMILDLTRFVANGVWEERSDVRSLLANGIKTGTGPRILYQLESVILHYGYTTSSGHFVCIRRKPSNLGDHYGPVSVQKSCPDGCTCESCVFFGQVRGRQGIPGKGWLRISDDEVEEVGEEALLESRAAIFMLFYEKVGEYEGKGLERASLRDEEGDASQSSKILDS